MLCRSCSNINFRTLRNGGSVNIASLKFGVNVPYVVDFNSFEANIFSVVVHSMHTLSKCTPIYLGHTAASHIRSLCFLLFVEMLSLSVKKIIRLHQQLLKLMRCFLMTFWQVVIGKVAITIFSHKVTLWYLFHFNYIDL